MKSNFANTKMRSKKRVYRKDDRYKANKPRRPLSAYNIFFREERALIVRERNQSASSGGLDGHSKGKEFFASMGKTIAKRWYNLAPSRMQHFKQLAAMDMERYRSEKAQSSGLRHPDKSSGEGKVTQARNAASIDRRPVLHDDYLSGVGNAETSTGAICKTMSQCVGRGETKDWSELQVKSRMKTTAHVIDTSKSLARRDSRNGQQNTSSSKIYGASEATWSKSSAVNARNCSVTMSTEACQDDKGYCTSSGMEETKTSDVPSSFLGVKYHTGDFHISSVSTPLEARLNQRDLISGRYGERSGKLCGVQQASTKALTSIRGLLFDNEGVLIGNRLGRSSFGFDPNQEAITSNTFNHTSLAIAKLLAITTAEMETGIDQAKGEAMLSNEQARLFDQQNIQRHNLSSLCAAIQQQHKTSVLDDYVAQNELLRCTALQKLRGSQQANPLILRQSHSLWDNHGVNQNQPSIQFLHYLAQVERESAKSDSLINLSRLSDQPHVQAHMSDAPFAVQQQQSFLSGALVNSSQQLLDAPFFNSFFMGSHRKY